LGKNNLISRWEKARDIANPSRVSRAEKNRGNPRKANGVGKGAGEAGMKWARELREQKRVIISDHKNKDESWKVGG